MSRRFKKGSITLSCGHKWEESMGVWVDLDFSFKDTVCTRDPEQPFVLATIFGSYCPSCQERIKKYAEEEERSK